MVKWHTKHSLTNVRLICRRHATIERHLLSNNSSSTFYKHVNKKFVSSHTLPPLYISAGILLTSNARKTFVINEYFASVFTHDSISYDSCFISSLRCCTPSDDVDFSVDIKFLKKCKTFA